MLRGKDITSDKAKLMRALRLWFSNLRLDNLFRHTNQNLQVYRGVNHLKNMILPLKQKFFNRIKKVLSKDPRTRMLLALEKKLNKPRYSLGRAFDRWRRINLNEKMAAKEVDLVNRLLFGQCKRVAARVNRDLLKGKFYRWRNALRKPDDYYDKICRGVKNLQNHANKFLSDPFTKIANHKNYKKIFENLMGPATKYAQRRNKEKIIKAWLRWKNICTQERNKDWACKLMGKFRDGQLKRLKSNLMSRYWRKFAGFRPKSLHYPDVHKGLQRIANIMRNAYWDEIKNRLMKKGNDRMQNRALNLFFGQSKTFNKKKLRRALLIWYRNMLRDDSDLKNEVLKKLKKMYYDNYVAQPLEKYLRRWYRILTLKPIPIKNVIDGDKKLTNVFRKRHFPNVINKLKDHVSPQCLQKALLDKVLPTSKLFSNKLKRQYFDKWRQKNKDIKIKDLKLRTLSILYEKDKNKTVKFFVLRAFRIWKGLIRKADMIKIIAAEKKIFAFMVNKYLAPDFVKDMKNYAYFKFLREIFNGCSKYQVRALRPFFTRWRTTTLKLVAQGLKHGLWARMVRRMSSDNLRKAIDNILRKKLQQWREQAKNLAKKINEDTDKGVKALTRKAYKEYLPAIIKKLKENEMLVRQKHKLSKYALPLNDKMWKIVLKRKFDLWNRQARKLGVRDFRVKIMENSMKFFRNKYIMNCLARRFNHWKPERHKKNYRPIEVAGITLKRLFTRRPFQELMKKCEMLNMKAPYGMSLSQVLLRKGKNYGKLLVLRNMNLRPYWKFYRAQVKNMGIRDFNENVMRKLFFRGGSKNQALILRHYWNRWKDKKNQMELKEIKEKTAGNLLKNMYANNHRLWLRKKLLFWKAVNDDYFKRLNKITMGSTKLNRFVKKKHLTDLLRRLDVKKEIQRKMEKSKKILKIMLMGLDKGKLLIAFSFWKKRLFDYKLLRLKKHTILRNLLSKNDSDVKNSNLNKLREYYLKWRIISNPKNLYEKLERVVKGHRILGKNLRNRFNKDIYDVIKDAALKNKIKEILLKTLLKFDNSFGLMLLAIKFKHWRSRLGDALKMKKKLKDMVNKLMKNKKGNDELVNKPLNYLLENAKKFKSGKK